jgi:UDP-N-acetylmuramate--alanine ligase
MSGIAEILHSMGHTVQGSDMAENANVQRLRDKGIKVCIGHTPENIEGAAIIVPSSAVKADNPEVMEARRQDIPVIPRSEMLAELMRFKASIAVAGTHGKTTTTSLVAAVLSEGNLDPTVINGGIINTLGTNAVVGKGNWMVVEADESDGTFVKVPCTIAVITNIEPEHLDFYGSFDNLRKDFLQFVKQIPFYGFSVICSDHPEVRKMIPKITERHYLTYGFNDNATVQAVNIRRNPTATKFDVLFKPKNIEINDVSLSIHGDHNILNSLAAIAIGIEMGLSSDAIKKALANFKGVKRRFTHAGTYKESIIIDDYAHHPTEIKAVLKAAKGIAKGKVIAVVQPHRYSRLQSLFDDFAKCYDDCDHIILLPVHSAGETSIIGIDHISLGKAIQENYKKPLDICNSPEELTKVLHNLLQKDDYAICMGAGSITTIAHDLEEKLKEMDR